MAFIGPCRVLGINPYFSNSYDPDMAWGLGQSLAQGADPRLTGSFGSYVRMSPIAGQTVVPSFDVGRLRIDSCSRFELPATPVGGGEGDLQDEFRAPLPI